MALSVAGCSSGSPPKARLDGSSDVKADARDAGDDRDLRPDGADAASGETASEVPAPHPDASDATQDRIDAASDRADNGTGGAAGTAGTAGTAGSGAGGAGTGGMGTGGTGTGGTGTGGTGTGGTGTGGTGTGGTGTGGTGTGGTGTGGTGTGGMGTGGTGTGGSGSGAAGGDADAGLDAPADGGDDASQSGTGGATGNDAGGDLAPDGADVCGPGCPLDVRPAVIWLAADYGVQCDSTSKRVTEWTNRGSNGGPVVPLTGVGPLCANPTSQLGGRPVLSFDAPQNVDNKDDDGVLTLDLTPLGSEAGYTVFVVERRQSNEEGYFLGTTLALNAVACDLLNHSAYRFGYEPPILWSGPYVADDQGDCAPPMANPAAFSAGNPQAALDIEVFDPALGHVMSSNGVELYRDADKLPIAFDPGTVGFIGRAFQPLDGNHRHSRFHGDIAEIVIYAFVLTSSEIQSVATYLSDRWGGLPH